MYKAYKLSDYNKYQGKVIQIEEVNVYYPGFKNKGGYEIRYIPMVEYYTVKDTSTFSDGALNYFSSYERGDIITVLEKKNDRYKTHIYSFWYYYLSIPELIILLLISFILLAICMVYVIKV